MDMSFAEPGLAALCNSRARLVARWGPELATIICRRLLDLAAADPDCLNRLPGVQVILDNGAVVITFEGVVKISGALTSELPTHGQITSDSRLIITSLTVTHPSVSGSKQ